MRFNLLYISFICFFPKNRTIKWDNTKQIKTTIIFGCRSRTIENRQSNKKFFQKSSLTKKLPYNYFLYLTIHYLIKFFRGSQFYHFFCVRQIFYWCLFISITTTFSLLCSFLFFWLYFNNFFSSHNFFVFL